MRLPMDYARLNEWDDGFVVDAGQTYEVVEGGTDPVHLDGSVLAAGLPLRLEPGALRSIRVCPID